MEKSEEDFERAIEKAQKALNEAISIANKENPKIRELYQLQQSLDKIAKSDGIKWISSNWC